MSAGAKPDYGIYPTLTREEARAAAKQLITLDVSAKPVTDDRLTAIKLFYYREARCWTASAMKTGMHCLRTICSTGCR